MDRDEQTSLPTPATGRASDHQLETIARMAARGRPVSEIAPLVGLSAKRVNELIKGDVNQKFDQLKLEAQLQVSRADAGHHFRLLDMSELAYTAYQDGFTAKDEHLKAKRAEDWMDRCFPQQSVAQTPIDQPPPGGQNFTAISNHFNVVMNHLKTLAGKADPDAHLLSGADALPRPPGQLEVLNVEPLPGPTETEDSLDLTEVSDSD